MSSNVYHASNQWAERPDDERFESLDDLYLATKQMKDHATQKIISTKLLEVVAVDGEVMVQGEKKTPARISNWAFNQLCGLAESPAKYLQSIEPERAAANLNADLAKRVNDVKLLINTSDDASYPSLIRAANGPTYARIWSSDIVLNVATALQNEAGWRVPTARPVREGQKGTRRATQDDVLHFGKSGLSVKVGDPIAPAGLYYGPSTGKDLFMFFVNEDRRISGLDDLCRFALIGSSEVGASYLWGMFGYYDAVCGNHIIWNASNVLEFKIKHIGDTAFQRAFASLGNSFAKFSDDATKKDAEVILKAKGFKLGNDKEEVVDKLYEKKIATRKALDKAYEIAELSSRYGDPRTAWAMTSGLTEYSQSLPFADRRVELDRNAGKILMLAK